jgi:predicted O-methyltransferase YrrM
MRMRGDVRALEVPGMTKSDLLFLYHVALSITYGGLAVEIGSYLGSSAACIAAALRHRGGHLYCVDTWRNDAMTEGPRSTFDEFVRNTEKWRAWITPLHGFSSEIAQSFNRDIHFLFIDGDHSYEGCLEDIRSWFPKVRAGGTIVFHDYPRASGVRRNVEELLEFDLVSCAGAKQNFFYCRKAKRSILSV